MAPNESQRKTKIGMFAFVWFASTQKYTSHYRYGLLLEIAGDQMAAEFAWKIHNETEYKAWPIQPDKMNKIKPNHIHFFPSHYMQKKQRQLVMCVQYTDFK